MLRHSTIFSAFVTAALFSFQPVTAWGQTPPKPEPDAKNSEKLDKILERLDTWEKRRDAEFSDYRKSVDGIVNNAKNDVDRLREEINGAKTSIVLQNLDLRAAVKRLETLEAQLKTLI